MWVSDRFVKKSMRYLTDSIQNSQQYAMVVASCQRKSLIGQKAFKHLLQTFVSGDTDAPRQWSGQFILEMIRKSKDSGGILGLGGEENLQKLGATVLSEPDYVLRLLASVIIQVMVASNLEPGIFWPPSTPQPVLDTFSSGAPIDSHWIEKFNGFVSSQDTQQKAKSQRMHAVQTINIGPSDIGHSNYSIGVLVSSPLQIMITEDNRFQFMEIHLGHIDKLALRERTATLDVYLCGNGFYMTNGLMEKADKVSMVFENRNQGILVREAIEQQCRFVEGANRRFRATNGFSNLARSRSHEKQGTSLESFLCKTGVVITLPLDVGKSTAQNPRRKASFAAMVLSVDEEAINGSSAHLDLSVSSNLNEGDQDKSHPEGEQWIINNKDCSGTVGSKYDSYSPRVSETPEPRNPPGSRSHVQERNPSLQIALTAVNPPKTQDNISFNGEGVVEPHISQGQGDCQIGLPSLALQALQLQPHDSSPFANVPGHEDQIVINSLDLDGLDVQEAPLGPENPATNSEQLADILVEDSPPSDINPGPFNNPTNMGQQINVPFKHPSEKQNGVGVSDQIASSSKLKRPHNRISEFRTNQLTIDWDQDLRVEDGVVCRPPSSSKKQKRTPPQLKGSTKTSKPKSISRSSKKNKPEQTLDLTPHIVSTSAKSKTKKTGRQVTKTSTSARQRRAAAEKANQKLALANEFENAAYDVDDPIESSPPEESVLTANQGNWTGSTAVISPVVTSDDAQVQAVRSTDGVANPGTSRPAPEVSNLVTSPEILGPNQAANEKNNPPACLAGEEDADPNPDFQESDIAAKESSPSAGPVEVSNSELSSNMDNALKQTAVECTENSWGTRLSEVLAKAGIISSNSLIAVNNANDTDCQTRKDVSEISKNVSKFITRQAVRGQRPSGDDNDKLDHSQVQLVGNAGAPAKVARPNDGAYQSVPEGDKHETQSTKPKIQSQPIVTTEIHSILMPKSNGPNKVEGNKRDVFPETAIALRKVQIVGFDSNGPKNQCTISGGISDRDLTKYDTSTHENHNNEDARPAKDGLENCSGDRIDKIDDMDEMSLIPTSECRRLNIGSQNGDMGSHIHSSSVCEVTEVEFRSQRRAVQPIPSQSQRVDENGSPQPLRRNLRTKEPTSNILPDAELPIDSTSAASQPLELSASLSGEDDAALNNRISTSSDSESTHVDLKHQDFATNNENHDSSNFVNPPQPRDAPLQRQDESTKNFAVRHRSNLMNNSFWRRSAPSAFAGRLRGQQKENQTKKSQRNKKGYKHVRTMKKVSRKSNIMPFIESSSELEHDIKSSEADIYDTESRCWDTAEGSSGSYSNLSYTLVEECRDVESEWQNALRATQKTSLDILLDTSSRLIRHLLDEEQAITKVVDTYKKNGIRLIEELKHRYDEELEECENRLLPIKEELIGHCKMIMTLLISDRQSFLKQPAMKDLSAAVHKRKKLLGRIDAVIKEYETDD
ncbi:hypothetical protein ACJ73_00177 [Blastomyces percursus]|uniref:PH-like domain-containing protein n=1 Tax=Blastomyces percursus TaxID=1658174 RepID=A0A1J9RLE3_9EURO|nr:hypothetical protein ACJ73_00177 [Blastomyces percursus]